MNNLFKIAMLVLWVIMFILVLCKAEEQVQPANTCPPCPLPDDIDTAGQVSEEDARTPGKWLP